MRKMIPGFILDEMEGQQFAIYKVENGFIVELVELREKPDMADFIGQALEEEIDPIMAKIKEQEPAKYPVKVTFVFDSLIDVAEKLMDYFK